LSGAADAFEAGILAPDNDDPELQKTIKALRKDKQRVIVDLTGGKGRPEDQHCNRRLVHGADGWVVEGSGR
ncbi:MAG: hypothetical protein O7D36_07200, partial [Gammaproteobacteria bacterium]|nr:hypothetical protein [Gammaproteobacteria bacterium]